MSVTIIPWVVVLVFGGIFVFAGVREYLHRREHGPPEDPRAAFDFDEDAPSYEEPEEPEDTETDTDQDTEGETGAPPVRPDQPPVTTPDPEPHPDPDIPDRNESPR